MFVDIAKIKIKSGNGGDGAVSFHREKYIASGGPDGGDGGKGGDIIFQADDSLSTLADFRYKRKYKAENGQNGSGGRSFGKSAKNLIIKVPKGTLIREIESNKLIADISDDKGQTILKGGKGGWGNSHFANSTRQTPRFAKAGQLGEEIEVQLELKLLADVGLVGYPNVGKSTLISVVTGAKPIVADYHFTTITPVLGVVNLHKGSSFVIADIPGLIEGAGEGLGLGHQFLRHVERCRMLVHLVDVSGSEGRDPISDFEIINKELKKFNADISKKPMIVVGNKCDLANEEQIKKFKNYVESKGYEFFDIMAPIHHNVDKLIKRIEGLLSKLPPIKRYEIDPLPLDIRSKSKDKSVTITKEEDFYVIEGDWLKNIMRSVNFDDYESLQYFHRVLLDNGVIDGLHNAGAVNGDSVKIYDIEFDLVE